MRFQLLTTGLWAVVALAALAWVPAARADPNMNAWNQLMMNQLAAGFSPFNTSRAVAATHLAQWTTIKAILGQQGLTPDSPNLPLSSLLPALQSGVAAAAKTVLLDRSMMWVNATQAVQALYTSQVISSQTAAIAAGEAAAQAVIAMRTNDGSTATMAPFRGDNTTCGIWRSTPTLNQPAAAPQWRYVKPWAMESPSQFRLPPPPDFRNSTIYQQAYIEVMQYGSKTSTFRTPAQTMQGEFWHLNVQFYSNELIRKLTADYNIVESARYFLAGAIAFADMQIAGWDTKYQYLYWRPITAIRMGNCENNPTLFPKDETWVPLLETPNHPEYMAGHAATSAAVVEAIRFLNGGDAIPPIIITNYMMPNMGGRTFTSLTALANEIARSRVLAGAHFSFSTTSAQVMGRQVGMNTIRVMELGGCGPGKYLWGSACLPCPMDTYWPSNLFTDTCTPCAAGFTSPEGAAACEPRLIVALRANGREFAGEPADGDGGMMMPMGVASASGSAAASSSASAAAGFSASSSGGSKQTTTLNRKGRGVIQLVQRNPQAVPSGALAVVTLTLPRGVKYAGTARIVPPLTSKTSKRKTSEGSKPTVSGQTLTWRFAPLAAGQERVFTIKVAVEGTTSSWLSFQASTYYLTPAGAAGMGSMSMGGTGGMSEMPMLYGLTDLVFNVPVN